MQKSTKALQPERQRGQNLLFRVILTLDSPQPTLPSSWALSQMGVETGTSKFDLTLTLKKRADGLRAHFEYSTDLFDEASIVGMAGHWQMLLEGFVTEPEQRLSELPLLREKERHQLLIEWNSTQAKYPIAGYSQGRRSLCATRSQLSTGSHHYCNHL